jgi:hypothetical protein
MPADYRFLREHKNPVIDLLRTEAQRGGNLGPEHLERIADKAGCSVHTLKAWWFGDTRQPHHLTVRFVAEALGCKLQIVRSDGTEVRGPRG